MYVCIVQNVLYINEKEDKTDVNESFEKSAGGLVFEFQRIPLIRKDRISTVPVLLTYGAVCLSFELR